jgi:hypothetical protein
MTRSPTVIGLGALCFGLVVGYITYRTLARSPSGGVSDLAAVIAAIGGGAVTTIFQPQTTDTFGWYSIGLLLGLAAYGGIFWLVNGRKQFGTVMGRGSLRPPGTTDNAPKRR